MIVRKIAIITGDPFGEHLKGSIALQENNRHWYGLKKKEWLLQTNYNEKGYRKATLEEIKHDWNQIKERWDPQPGDLVRITQESYNCTDDFVITKQNETNCEYWGVRYLNGDYYTIFNKDQIVLSPNHGWGTDSTLIKEQITIIENPKISLDRLKYSPEAYNEFKYLNSALVDLIDTRVTGFVSEILSLGEVLMGGFDFSQSLEGVTFWGKIVGYLQDKDYTKASQHYLDYVQNIENSKESVNSTLPGKFSSEVLVEKNNIPLGLWELIKKRVCNNVLYEKTLANAIRGGFNWAESVEGYKFWAELVHMLDVKHYETVQQFYTELKTGQSKETLPTSTMPAQRFKIGDTVTYKSKEECGGYNYGGEDQKGFKGRIVNYGRFNAEKNCFIIGVTSNESCDYSMLESEFYEYDQIPLPQEPTSKTLLYTIKDRVLRFNGHEVKVGDIVSYDCEYIKRGFQTVTKIERDGYSENYPFLVGGDWDNINNISNFVNHGQPNSKEPFKQPLKFKVYEKVLFITFKKGESGTIVKVDEKEEYFKYYVRLSSDNNICVCGEKDIISYSREEERALTIDEHLDSLTKFYSSGLIVEDSEIKLTIPLVKKYVSDYDQKPVTLYKSKNKLSLKPINLTK
jgi:hypothetical protein